jgi:hypothetical protein
MTDPIYYLIIKRHAGLFVGTIVLDGGIGSDTIIYKFVHKNINKVENNLNKEYLKLKPKHETKTNNLC